MHYSREASQSRGSGANIPADKMWSDHSPLQSSPLVYVESPITANGIVPVLNNSGRISAAPISGGERRPSLRGNHGSDSEDHHHLARSNSGGGTPSSSVRNLKMLETFREAKHHAHHAEESQPIRQVVSHVEPFQPLDKHDHGHSTSKTSNSHHHHHSGHQPHKESLKIVRPSILTRTQSIGSDASSVDGLTMLPLSGPGRAHELAVQYDALLNNTVAQRELLVSPLCAFDDCASLGSWSMKSGGSRRSSTSSKHPHKSHSTHHKVAVEPHYRSGTVSSHNRR